VKRSFKRAFNSFVSTFFVVSQLAFPLLAVQPVHALDTGFKSPSATGGNHNQWSNPSNAYASDDVYTTESSEDQDQSYENFGLSIPAGQTIDGIEVQIEAYDTDSSSGRDCRLEPRMWSTSDNEHSDRRYAKTTNDEATYTFGSPSDLWNSTWIPSDFSDANFHFEIQYDDIPGESCSSSADMYVDHMQIKVYHSDPPPQADLVVSKTNDAGGAITVGNDFDWTLTVTNNGQGVATFDNQDILEDDMPGNADYTPTNNIVVTTGGGVTGNIDCDINSDTLVCDDNNNGSIVVIPAGGWFTVSFTVTPDDTGSLNNPDNGNSDVCMVDPDNEITESNENNNDCSDSVDVQRIQPVNPAPNPPLNRSCGLDIALVLDVSGSINDTELGQMKTAFNGFVDAFRPATPTQFSVTEFSTTANVLQAFTDDATDVKAAINLANDNGHTNWEDGLIKARGTFDPRPANPDLVVFASDGLPNTIGNGPADNAAPDGSIAAMNPAVTAANAVKADGTRIITLGIGDNLSTANLERISSADAVITSDFSNLAASLAELANELCGGTITVQKLVDADGNLNTPDDQTPVEDWEFDINGTPTNPDPVLTDVNGYTVPVEVEAGIYSVSEDTTERPLLDVQCTGASSVGDPNSSGIAGLEVGNTDIVSCVFINGPETANLEVVKFAVNDNGGTVTSENFTVRVNDEVLASPVNTVGPPGVTISTYGPIAVDDDAPVEITEDGYDGYETTSLTCYDVTDTQNQIAVANPFTPELGHEYLCNIFNDDIAPTVTLIKNVINDDNGQALPGAFQLTLNGDDAPQGQAIDVMANAELTVGEDEVDGYELTSILCFDGNDPVAHPLTLAPDQDVTCIVTNNDTPPEPGTITVYKRVTNNSGGDLDPADFYLTVNNSLVMSGDTNSFEPGQYTVNEILPDNDYRQEGTWCRQVGSQSWSGRTFTLGEDQDWECVIGNNDNPANITIYKHVINDDGGRLHYWDFPLFVGNERVSHSQLNYFDANQWYDIYENEREGYEHLSTKCYNRATAQYLGDRIYAELGESYVCHIVNDDIAPTITMAKKVINDNGGELGPKDFQLTINNNPVPQDTQLELRAGSWYWPSEWRHDDYDKESVKCYLADDLKDASNGNGQDYLRIPFKLKPGQNVRCVVVNNDKPAEVTVHKLTWPIFHEQDWAFVVGNNGQPVEKFILDTMPSWSPPYSWKTVRGLDAGTVQVGEQENADWVSAMYAKCYLKTGHWSSELIFDGRLTNKAEFKVGIGDKVDCYFLNTERGDVKVTKFHDQNENGYFDEGEPTLPGWDMTLDAYAMDDCIVSETVNDRSKECDDNPVNGVNGLKYGGEPDKTWTQTTEEDGMTTFEDLWPSPFALYELSEEGQEGWHQTGMYCRYDIVRPGARGVDNGVPMPDGHYGDRLLAMVLPGMTVECFVGNTHDPALTIEKTNDQPDPTVTGDTVQYTIVVTVPEESGCVYREGMAHYAIKKIGNGEKPHFMMNCETEDEPEDMEVQALIIDDCIECEPNGEGDEVTVSDLPPEGFTYVPGSWTASSNVRGDLVAAGITGEPGYASPGQWTLTSPSSPFLVPGEVVTLTYNAVIEAAVSNGVYPDTAFVEGYTQSGERIFGNLHFTDTPFVGTQVEVLEVDPVTGGFVLGVLSETGNPAILAPIAGILVSAGALLTGARRKERRWLKKFSAAVGGAFAALALTLVFSASAFAVGGFVELNISTPQQYINYADFNINYGVISTESGQSFNVKLLQDDVHVNNQWLNAPVGDLPSGDSGVFAVSLADEGTYEFKIEASNGGTHTSDVVTVVYDKTAPTSPEFGTTERDGDTYTVNFTAPSGDVEMVKIYASTEKSFDLDDTTLVGEVVVTAGEASSFEYDAPDSDQRYFAVVAVDQASNQSAAVGDAEVQVVAAHTDDPATLDSDGDGVPDVDDPAPFDPDVTGQETDDAEGQTAGATTDEQTDGDEGDSDNTTAWIVVALLATGGIGYYFYRSRGESDAL